MPSINGIQPTISSLPRPQSAPVDDSRRQDARDAGSALDVYSGASQAWRNRATSAVDQSACRCGNCPACAAQTYALEGQRLNGDKEADTGEPGTVQALEESGQEEGMATASEPRGVDGEVLSQQEQAQLAELKKVDRAVRAHEQAHMAAAGGLVRGGVSLSYENGADGRRYAVGGEVSIDISKESDPADTIVKMRNVRAAALAPVDPSPQDRKVAVAAMVTMNNAMNELQLAKLAGESGENTVAQAGEEMSGGDNDATQSQREYSGETGS